MSTKEQSAAVWKLVPVEPTREMLDAYCNTQGRFNSARSDWAAMLAAAPHPTVAEPMAQQEPVAWMWQHDETGRVGFVDLWQVEHGWQANNPRCRLVRSLYATPPTQAPAEPAVPAPSAADQMSAALDDAFRAGKEYMRRQLDGRDAKLMAERDAYREQHDALLRRVASGLAMQPSPPILVAPADPVRARLLEALRSAEYMMRCQGLTSHAAYAEVCAAIAAAEPADGQAADDEWNEAGKYAQQLLTALQEADTIMGHEDDHTAWRERWQHLWPWGGHNDEVQAAVLGRPGTQG